MPRGPNGRKPGIRVVHSVGSDVAIGKKAVTVELDAAARARGLKSVYVPTGQTGVAIAGWGIAVDHVLADYVSGAMPAARRALRLGQLAAADETPFLLVDLVVASVLTALGIVTMPPVIISAPFKILLFVLADGWHLVVRALSVSFQ